MVDLDGSQRLEVVAGLPVQLEDGVRVQVGVYQGDTRSLSESGPLVPPPNLGEGPSGYRETMLVSETRLVCSPFSSPECE